MPQPLILSLGSINADFAFEVEGDFAVGGTSPARRFYRRAGGKGANVAAFLHRVGVPVRLLGRVGDDDLADQALQPLREAGIDISGVTAASGEATGVAMIGVPEDGEKTILLAANANRSWDEAALASLRQAIDEAPEGSLLALDFEVSREALETAFAAALARGMPVIADASFAEDIESRDLTRLAAITPNAKEAATMTGLTVRSEADARTAARRLVGRGVKAACVKLSDGGCVFAAGQKVSTIEAPHVEVVDKTGAGDAFTAAFALALYEGRSPFEAAQWGVAASSLAVTARGSQEAYPDRRALQAMVREVAGDGHA